MLPWALGFASGFYGVVSAGAGRRFHLVRLESAHRTAGEDRKPAKLLFAYSIAYLFAIFAVLLADTIATRALTPALG